MSGLSTDSVESTLAAVRNLMKEIGTEDAMEGPSTISLGKALTINEVGVVRDSWVAGAMDTKELEIDASDIEALDTAGLQLLLALIRNKAARGASVTWGRRSEKFDEIVTTLGLGALLGIA